MRLRLGGEALRLLLGDLLLGLRVAEGRGRNGAVEGPERWGVLRLLPLLLLHLLGVIRLLLGRGLREGAAHHDRRGRGRGHRPHKELLVRKELALLLLLLLSHSHLLHLLLLLLLLLLYVLLLQLLRKRSRGGQK